MASGKVLALGERLSFFSDDSAYHGGPGEGWGKRQFYTCGQHFEGHWKDDEQEGQGTLKTSASTSYDGQWSAGEFHGLGTYTWASGTRYEGEWSEGKQHGQGKLTLYSGNVYDGAWRANKRHAPSYTLPE